MEKKLNKWVEELNELDILPNNFEFNHREVWEKMEVKLAKPSRKKYLLLWPMAACFLLVIVYWNLPSNKAAKVFAAKTIKFSATKKKQVSVVAKPISVREIKKYRLKSKEYELVNTDLQDSARTEIIAPQEIHITTAEPIVAITPNFILITKKIKRKIIHLNDLNETMQQPMMVNNKSKLVPYEDGKNNIELSPVIEDHAYKSNSLSQLILKNKPKPSITTLTDNQ